MAFVAATVLDITEPNPILSRAIGLGFVNLPVSDFIWDVWNFVDLDFTIYKAGMLPFQYCYYCLWTCVIEIQSFDLSNRKVFFGNPPSYDFGRISIGFNNSICYDDTLRYSTQVTPQFLFHYSNIFGKQNPSVPLISPPTQFGEIISTPQSYTVNSSALQVNIKAKPGVTFTSSISYYLDTFYIQPITSPSPKGVVLL